MVAGRKPMAVPCCKFCKKVFDKAVNPLVKDPGPNDLLKRRAALARDCKACYGFLKAETHDNGFGDMTPDALVEYLEQPGKQDEYNASLEEWCEARREGKRRARSKGDATATVEQASSMETKQVLGYLWPPALLKKHGKDVPKKLQSIVHQGKQVKGIVREDWVLGCIEVASTGSRTARQVNVVGEGDGEDGNEAAVAFEAASKRLRLTTSEKDDEITLKMPKASGEDDELYNLLWGAAGASAVSDDEKDEGSAKKKAKVVKAPGGSAGSARPRPARSTTKDAAGSDAGSAYDGPSGANGLFGFFGSTAGNKKAGIETKDLDKSEALNLQTQQLKLQMEDSRGFGKVTLSKTSNLLEKVETRLAESGKSFLEIIRIQGSGCRAELVLQSLKDSKDLLCSMQELLEALQDAETAPATVQSRAAALRELGVMLPMQVNNAICQRFIVSMLQDDKIADIMRFLDMKYQAEFPNGIGSIIPKGLAEDAARLISTEFQGGCIIHLINHMLLRDYSGDGGLESDERKAFMSSCMSQCFNFLKVFLASELFDLAAPLKSTLREDVQKLNVVLRVVNAPPDSLEPADIDQAENARSNLLKSKGTFQSALTVYPSGVHLAEATHRITSAFRQDQLLEAEIGQAADFANSMKDISKETVLKKRDDGEFDFCVPSSSKFGDMAAKFVNFHEKASARCKDASKEYLCAVEMRINQLCVALLEAGSFRVDQKFEAFPKLLDKLVAKQWSNKETNEGVQMLGEIVAYQCTQKLPLLKLLGKTNATEIEATFAVVSSAARLLQGCWGLLCSLPSSNLTEGVVLDEGVVALIKYLTDDAARKQLRSILPAWDERISKLVDMLKSKILEFVAQATSTFHPFALKLLSPEIDIGSILTADTVGSVDLDDKDLKLGFDYCTFYKTYMAVCQEVVGIKGSDEKEIKVDGSFLCLAGTLLNLSKYMVAFQDKLAEVEQLKSFKDVTSDDWGLVMEKKKADGIETLPILLQMASHFGKFAAACTSFANVTKDMDDGSKEKIYYKMLLEKASGIVLQTLTHCNNELGSAWGCLDESFKLMLSKHAFPGMFQTDKLEKSKICLLVGDPTTKFLLFMGPRCSALCNNIKMVLNAVRDLVKEVIAHTAILNMLLALESDLAKFSSSSSHGQGVPPDGTKTLLCNFTFFQGTLTLGQVLSRDLNPGETRLGLCKRALDLLISKGMQFEPTLKQKVDALAAGK